MKNKTVKYTYRLINKINPALDLRPYTEEIAAAIQSFGGRDTRVYARSYSFKVPYNMALNDGMKRRLGKEIAKIKGIGRYKIKRNYFYSSGRPAKSTHLFKRNKEKKSSKKRTQK